MELLKKLALIWVGCFFIGLTFGKIYSPDFDDNQNIVEYLTKKVPVSLFDFETAENAPQDSIEKPKISPIGVKVEGKTVKLSTNSYFSAPKKSVCLLYKNNIYVYHGSDKPIAKHPFGGNSVASEGAKKNVSNSFVGTSISKKSIEETMMATATVTGFGGGFTIKNVQQIVMTEKSNWQRLVMLVTAGVGLGVGYYVGYKDEPAASYDDTVEKMLTEDTALWEGIRRKAIFQSKIARK